MRARRIVAGGRGRRRQTSEDSGLTELSGRMQVGSAAEKIDRKRCRVGKRSVRPKRSALVKVFVRFFPSLENLLDSLRMNTHKVDRFSRLPPELIDEVFDLAYHDRTKTAPQPLCKRLLPHYQRQLFREVTIIQTVGFREFVQKLHQDNGLGGLIKHLRLDLPRWTHQSETLFYNMQCGKEEDGDREEEEQNDATPRGIRERRRLDAPEAEEAPRASGGSAILKEEEAMRIRHKAKCPEQSIIAAFRLLPRLQSLCLGEFLAHFLVHHSLPPLIFAQQLHSLRLDVGPLLGSESESLTGFLAHFPSLTVLHLEFLDKDRAHSLPSLGTSNIHTLTLAGIDIWTKDLAELVGKFSNLSTLVLICRYEDGLPKFNGLIEPLAELELPLRKLDLLIVDPANKFDDIPMGDCDPFLPSFALLRHLRLDPGTYGPDFAAHLRRLPQLETLRFYAFDFEQDTLRLLPLVQGSSKPPKLRLLELEDESASMEWKTTGRRVEMHEEVSQDFDDWWAQWKQDGWPRLSYDMRWELQEDLENLVYNGRQNGVEVRGILLDISRVSRVRAIETSNRLVLEAFQGGDLDDLIDYLCLLRDGEDRNDLYDGVQGLNLDLENLRSRPLKLVKIDRPEVDWFQLTLEVDEEMEK